MKYWVILAFIGILGSLATALFFMMKNKADEKSRAQKMAFALAVRVGVSIVLFASILLAWKLGFINPTGIAPGQ
ncbi:MAG: twin transmembrane helix small protein [Pseudomonadota bacterium]